MIEDEIYDLYPRHIGKRDALTAIHKAIQRIPDELHETELDFSGNGDRVLRNPFIFLKEKVLAFARSPAGQAGKFTPHPTTWFNRSSYLDDESEWQRNDDREVSKSERQTQQRRTNIIDGLRGNTRKDAGRSNGEQRKGYVSESGAGIQHRSLKAFAGSD